MGGISPFLDLYFKIYILIFENMSYLGGSVGKESACNAGDAGLTPGLGRSLEGRHGNPLQYSCLENTMDRGAWCCKESDESEVTEHTHTTITLGNEVKILYYIVGDF